MKLIILAVTAALGLVAPRTGAWIETHHAPDPPGYAGVAPRTGAWIETILGRLHLKLKTVAPRTGAWIET